MEKARRQASERKVKGLDNRKGKGNPPAAGSLAIVARVRVPDVFVGHDCDIVAFVCGAWYRRLARSVAIIHSLMKWTMFDWQARKCSAEQASYGGARQVKRFQLE